MIFVVMNELNDTSNSDAKNPFSGIGEQASSGVAHGTRRPRSRENTHEVRAMAPFPGGVPRCRRADGPRARRGRPALRGREPRRLGLLHAVQREGEEGL